MEGLLRSKNLILRRLDRNEANRYLNLFDMRLTVVKHIERVRQRFQHFEKAFTILEQASSIKSPTVIERAGLIQLFEVSFELGWKILKDYLETEGYQVRSPRDAIKKAFAAEVITKGENWLQAIDDRNLTTHTYDEQIAMAIAAKIRADYLPLLCQLRLEFRDLLKDEKIDG